MLLRLRIFLKVNNTSSYVKIFLMGAINQESHLNKLPMILHWHIFCTMIAIGNFCKIEITQSICYLNYALLNGTAFIWYGFQVIYSFPCCNNTSQAVFGLLGQGCTEYVIFVKLFLLGTIIISLPMYATTINSAVPHFITLTTMSLITVKVACRVHVAYFKE